MHTEYLYLALAISLIWGVSFFIERAFYRETSIITSISTWFSVLWVFSAIILYLPIFRFPETFTFDDFIYVIGIHIWFSVGAILGLPLIRNEFKRERNELKYKLKTSIFSFKIIFVFAVFGIFGHTLKGVDAYLNSDFGFFERLSSSNLDALKEEYLTQKSHPIGNSIFSISNYMVALGQISVIYCGILYKFERKRIPGKKITFFVSFLFALFAMFNSIFANASRLGLVLTLLMFLVPYLTEGEARFSIRKLFKINFLGFLITSLLLVSAYVLSTSFLEGRIGPIDPFIMLTLTSRSTIDPLVLDFIDNDFTAKTLLLQLAYFAQGIPTLAYYLHNNGGWSGDLYFGLLTFGVWAQALFWWIPGFNVGDQVSSAYLAMTLPLTQSGYFSNVWGTMVRDLLTDFGPYGTFLFFFVFGYFANKIRFESVFSRKLEPKIVLVLVRIQLIWSSLHMLIAHQHFGYVFYLSVLIWMFAKFVKASKVL